MIYDNLFDIIRLGCAYSISINLLENCRYIQLLPDVVLGDSGNHLNESLIGYIVTLTKRSYQSNVSQVDTVSVQATRESVRKKIF